MVYPNDLRYCFNDGLPINLDCLPEGAHKNKVACLSKTFPMSHNLLRLKPDKGKILVLKIKVILACLLAAANKTEDEAHLLISNRRIAQHFNLTRYETHRLLKSLQKVTVQGLPLITYSEYNPKKLIKEAQAKKYHWVKYVPKNPNKNKTKEIWLKKRIRDIDFYECKERTYIDIYKNSVLELHTRERAIEIKFPAYEYIKCKKGRHNFSFNINLDECTDELNMSARVLLFLLQSSAAEKHMKNKKLYEYIRLFNFTRPNYMLKLFDKLVEHGFIEYTLEGRDKYTRENQIVQVKLTAREPRRIRTKAPDWNQGQPLRRLP